MSVKVLKRTKESPISYFSILSTRIVVKAINPQKLSHKFPFSVVVENMYEHEVVGPINQVENYEDAGEEVKGHLKIRKYQNAYQCSKFLNHY